MNDPAKEEVPLDDVVSKRASGGAASSTGHPRKAASRRGTRKPAWQVYRKFFVEEVLRQKPLSPSKDGRHIPLQPDPEAALIDERRGRPYISNAIRTSRYTIWDFLPKQLIFQFSRLANFYLLCVGIPQTIPGLSTTGNYTTILPLLIFVLLTILKEGYDDWKRHRLDVVENARPVSVLRRPHTTSTASWHEAGRWTWLIRPRHGNLAQDADPEKTTEPGAAGLQWILVRWRDLRVGDVIRLSKDEDVPADIALLYADGENGLAYTETSALDGETNLKSKQVSAALCDCSTIDAIARCQAEFVAEDPNPDLYRFDGRVTVKGKTLPLTLNEVIYRGCTVRNTTRTIGMVINTGEECKIRRNANRHPQAKTPAMERIANSIVITMAVYVIVLTVGCSMGYLIWQASTERHAWYLNNASVSFVEIIIGFLIQFNNNIPLALYVSLEIVRIGQMFMLNSDLGMYDEASDTPARCNTNTILENLGQVQYVFSDKTGTLTENVMQFRKISIAGTTWLHSPQVHDMADDRPDNMDETSGKKKEEGTSRFDRDSKATYVIGDDTPAMAVSSPVATSVARQASSLGRAVEHPELTTADLLENLRQKPHSRFSEAAIRYIVAMALCNTCLPVRENGHVDYQASSPDELALVRAARELGYMVSERSSQSLTLSIDGTKSERKYEILDVLEFSSKRKRMTIIVRCPDGRIWLICKGADSVILPRLKLARLAMQKAEGIRKNAEAEHERRRRSEAEGPRTSFGGRPSLTFHRRSSGLTSIIAGPSTRPQAVRAASLEGSKVQLLGNEPRMMLDARSPSMNASQPRMSVSDRATKAGQDKFAFLDDPILMDDSEVFARCFQHLDAFASDGLRTLVFADRYITEDEYAQWKKLYHEAETSLADRQERIEAAAELIEVQLDLVGASAIEDKLQPGVPETIDRLRRANIKIWMLTGDKRETAINIAHSARICKPESDISVVDAEKGDLGTQLLDILQGQRINTSAGSAGGNIRGHTVVVIDGHTLAVIDEAPNVREIFYSLIPTIDSVICCRASPAQKAFLVRAIRKTCNPSTSLFRATTGPLTLAIGDGANDLAMLAEAHVGVGISGKEGLQAARVADYSIAQFRFLSRLLLVHGRWNYSRTARFVLSTFWKEMFFYLSTALYQRYNGYTGTSLYESWSLTVLNVLFTSLAIIVPAVWEQDLAAETLLAVPELYVFGQRDRGLNVRLFIARMIGAASEGILIWFVCWAGYGGLGHVRDEGLFALGDLVFTVAMLWTNWKLLILDTHYKSVISLVSCFITISGWFAWNGFLGAIYAEGVTPYAVKNGFSSTFGPDAAWWLTLVIALSLLLLAELTYTALKRVLVMTGLWQWYREWLSVARCYRDRGLKTNGELTRREVAKDSAEDWDVEIWQEMQQDPAVKESLYRLSQVGEAEAVTRVQEAGDVVHEDLHIGGAVA